MSKAKSNEPVIDGAVVSSWRGYKRYACTTCAFDSLDLEKFQEHKRLCLACGGSLETHETEPPTYDTPPAPVGEVFVQE